MDIQSQYERMLMVIESRTSETWREHGYLWGVVEDLEKKLRKFTSTCDLESLRHSLETLETLRHSLETLETCVDQMKFMVESQGDSCRTAVDSITSEWNLWRTSCAGDLRRMQS